MVSRAVQPQSSEPQAVRSQAGTGRVAPGEETSGWMQRGARLLRVAIHVALGSAILAFRFPHISQAERVRHVQRWSAKLLDILNVTLSVRGDAPIPGRPPIVIACNHVSWLDVFVIHSVCPMRFVAKSEVRRWPILGWISERSGTLFIERENRHHAARINETIEKVLKRGDSVGIFPEGTTTRGDRLMPFHSSLLQASVMSGAPLLPAAVRYARPDGSINDAIVYIGDTTFVQSLGQILSCRTVFAELSFGPWIESAGRRRRELAREAEAAIAAMLHLSAPCRTPG
jgi:1-acyl-sn-glycerol-3-phosphate acyltransferase